MKKKTIFYLLLNPYKDTNLGDLLVIVLKIINIVAFKREASIFFLILTIIKYILRITIIIQFIKILPQAFNLGIKI